jgi:hypothetical protein
VKLAVDQHAGIWLWDANYLFGINKRVAVTPRSGDWHPILAYYYSRGSWLLVLRFQ